ncbi:centromere protein I-like isoform X2 [Lineus longissimus]|uniref:centromere protein I-like isoform X2 n=1 Tax=Lineus longissimus TaxID=88925 RepID=UPI00315CAEAA
MESDDNEDASPPSSPQRPAPPPRIDGRDIPVDQQLREAINILKNDKSGRRTFRGKVDLQTAFETIYSLSSDHGVTDEMMGEILDIAACGKYADTVCSKLVKSLIPRMAVPSGLVVSAVSWIGTTYPSQAVKVLIIRWMVLIFDRIEDVAKLQALYGPLFYFTQSKAICPYVCHLLYLLTRKEDVSLHRIRHLLNLQQKIYVGSQSHIMGLLSIYKLYCPSIVNIVVPKGRKSFFRQVDRNWALAIQQVMERHEAQTSIHERTQVDADDLLSQSKRRRIEVIPFAQSSIMNMAKQKSTSPSDTDPVPMQHINSFEQLVESMDRIEWPSQSGSVLKNRYLQHVVACNPDQIFNTRFQYWLGNTLQDEVLLHPYGNRGEKLLWALSSFADFIQEGVPVVESFLIKYMNSLNSTRLKPSLLALLKRLRLHSFPILHDLILEPLRNLFFSSSVYVKCQILVCITELFENYLTTEISRYQRAALKQTVSPEKSVDIPDFYSVFQEEVEELKPYKILKDTMAYMLDICSLAIQAEGCHVLLSNCVFNLLDIVSVFPKYRVPFVLLPPTLCIYSPLLSNNGLTLARLCENMILCRKAFQDLKESEISNEEFPESQRGFDEILTFNGYIRNIMDALWLCRAFTVTEDYSIFQLDPDLIRKMTIPRPSHCYSIYRSPAMIGFAWDFLTLTQPPDSKAVPDDLSINPIDSDVNPSEVYLKYLKSEGMDSVFKFLYSFSRRLSKTV